MSIPSRLVRRRRARAAAFLASASPAVPYRMTPSRWRSSITPPPEARTRCTKRASSGGKEAATLSAGPPGSLVPGSSRRAVRPSEGSSSKDPPLVRRSTDARTVPSPDTTTGPSGPRSHAARLRSSIHRTTVDGHRRSTRDSATQALRSNPRSTSVGDRRNRFAPARTPPSLRTSAAASHAFPTTRISRMAKREELSTSHPAPATSIEPSRATAAMRTRRSAIDLTDHVHLRLELDAVSVVDPLSDDLHQPVDVASGGSRTGHDEVGVLLRDPGAAHRHLLASHALDEPGGVIAGGVLEDAPAVRFGQRLRGPPPLPGLVHERPDLGGIPLRQPDGGPDHHPGRERRVPVPEPGLRRGHHVHPARLGGEDLHRVQHLVQGPPVGPGVHPHGPAQRCGDGHPELQARQRVRQGHARQGRQRHGGAAGAPAARPGPPPPPPSPPPP